MADIDKIDAPSVLRAFDYPPDHPAMALWLGPERGLLTRLSEAMTRCDAHPARTLVLLPYAQLLPMAQRVWGLRFPDGFAPRFETTRNWASGRGAFISEPTDITFDVALDTLTAQSLLVQAGFASAQEILAPKVVEAAHQLAQLAAACPPHSRAAWAAQARRDAVTGMDGAALAWEATIARVAVEWAAVSGYVSDILFQPALQTELDCLVVVQGLAEDPLAAGLQAHWQQRCVVLPLAPPGAFDAVGPRVALHACEDAEDEAQRTVACALQHIGAGRYPLALVSSDRALTRRVRAMLEGCGVQIRDENGWKLSTSSAAARIMALLRAAAWNASTDVVLDWLKGAPSYADVVDSLELALRRDQVRDWRQAQGSTIVQKEQALLVACTAIDQARASFKGARTFASWLAVLRAGLQACGLWDQLLDDGAGAKALAALRLVDTPDLQWNQLLDSALWAQRRLDLAEFTHWVNEALESASFQPVYPEHEQVVFLPMSQMLGRPFAATVLAGCDEVRLNSSPEPPGPWTAAQRAALRLPTREVLETQLRMAWHCALRTPVCDVLWRTSDDAGETLLPSTLVQLLQQNLDISVGASDPRQSRSVPVAPLSMPAPQASRLRVQKLSASAYADLRDCPYRFFALRQLGLKPVDELNGEVDKRDFGLWLHEVLKHFHHSLLQKPTQDSVVRRQLLDEASARTTLSMGLPEGEFLPFHAAWPAVREGYLDWLVDHEATGATFASAETEHAMPLGDVTSGGVTLVGRIDRTDSLPDGRTMVLDYKTESLSKTQARIKEPLEDTQIAFYAALLPDDTLRAGYVNVGERGGTSGVEQEHIVQVRDALLQGIQTDMQRIAAGAAMPAMGEGAACEFCQARGLCRKDFWTAA